MLKNMLGVALCDARGPLADLNEKLAGSDGERWLWELNRFLRKQQAWAPEVHTYIPPDEPQQVADWKQFYLEVFDLKVCDEITIPKTKSDFCKMLIVAKGLTADKVLTTCRKFFKVCLQDGIGSLDKFFDQNDREATRSYAIWIRGDVEADEGLKDLSACDLLKNRTQGITLLERLLLELFYFWKEKNHLDLVGGTLCSGTWNRGEVVYPTKPFGGQSVASVTWNPSHSELLIQDIPAGREFPARRAREVVV